jgi:hypothetical protein
VNEEQVQGEEGGVSAALGFALEHLDLAAQPLHQHRRDRVLSGRTIFF